MIGIVGSIVGSDVGSNVGFDDGELEIYVTFAHSVTFPLHENEAVLDVWMLMLWQLLVPMQLRLQWDVPQIIACVVLQDDLPLHVMLKVVAC